MSRKASAVTRLGHAAHALAKLELDTGDVYYGYPRGDEILQAAFARRKNILKTINDIAAEASLHSEVALRQKIGELVAVCYRLYSAGYSAQCYKHLYRDDLDKAQLRSQAYYPEIKAHSRSAEDMATVLRFMDDATLASKIKPSANLVEILTVPLNGGADTPVVQPTEPADESVSQPAEPSEKVAEQVKADNSEQAAIDGAHVSQEVDQFVFARSGTGFYIAGFGKSGNFGDYKGFLDIEKLLQSRMCVAMLVLDGVLLADEHSRQAAMGKEERRKGGEELQELMAKRDKAIRNNDVPLQQQLTEAIEALTKHLANATGVFNKPRDINNPFDKLRPKIYKRIKNACDQLRKARPPLKELADHFQLSIFAEGGDSFIYRPAGTRPDWQFHLPANK